MCVGWETGGAEKDGEGRAVHSVAGGDSAAEIGPTAFVTIRSIFSLSLTFPFK